MIITQYPYIDENGVNHEDRIKFYSDGGFQIIQEETGRIFDFVVDTYPSKYNYKESDTFMWVED